MGEKDSIDVRVAIGAQRYTLRWRAVGKKRHAQDRQKGREVVVNGVIADTSRDMIGRRGKLSSAPANHDESTSGALDMM